MHVFLLIGQSNMAGRGDLNEVCEIDTSRTSKIVGVLWHQGESNCAGDGYPTYQPRFETMMYALRKEPGLFDVPFVLGGLGDYLEFYPMKNCIHVNRGLKSIAATNERTGFVSAEGLTGKPDNLHFDSASLYEFGLRYFEEFERQQIQNKGPYVPAKREKPQEATLDVGFANYPTFYRSYRKHFGVSPSDAFRK